MRLQVGNFWNFELRSLLAIPCNQGWSKTGTAVMGKGIAKDASTRCFMLASEYGRFLQRMHGEVRVPWYRFGVGPGYLMVPTKPLNRVAPEMSWRNKADLETIERGLLAMRNTLEWAEIPQAQVVLPLLGCGEGKLEPSDVVPLMHRVLPEERFLLVVIREQYSGR